MLDVCVLGAMKVSTDGIEHRLSGAKQRRLLARLFVARGRSLSIDHLIDELWDADLPRDPGHALQAHISRLRAAVPVDISLSDGRYRIDPADFHTDADRFEHLMQQGQAALREADLSQAADLISEGLALWRGPALEGLCDVTTLRSESVRLEHLWSAAIADRIDLDLVLGRSSAVLAELHALVEANPFAERYWSQLMTALYCEGRTHEALDTFSRARSAFAEQLGMEPSGELRRLHRGILQQRTAAELLQHRIPRTHIGISETHATTDVTVRTLTSNRHDALTSLVGPERALLLTGPAGIGKTHLLRAIRTRFEAQRCDVFLLTASPLIRTVPLGIFIGVLPEASVTPAALVERFTRHRATSVLLIDNVDHLGDASLFVVSQLIRHARIPIVLTARELAGAPDEIRALYDSGDIAEITVSALAAADADELVTHTIGGSLTPETRRQIYDIAKGIPLHLREVLTASVDEGRLVRTDHGWELRDDPASTNRLTSMVAEPFHDLDDEALEAAAKIAIAGRYPTSALDATTRRVLARAGVIENSGPEWIQLAQPLAAEYLRERFTPALWREFAHDVMQVCERAVSDA